MTRVRTYRRRTKRGGTAIVREHERKDDLHAKLGEETEESPGQLLLTEAQAVKKRRRVKSRVKAQRKPAHVRRTRKVAPPAEAPAPVIKVSRGRDIFGNTPNPYAYADAIRARLWDRGYNNWYLKKFGVRLTAKTLSSAIKQLDVLIKTKAETASESNELHTAKDGLAEEAKELKKMGKAESQLVEEGFAHRIKDENWKKKNQKRIGRAVKRLQRKVTVAGNLTARAYNKIVHSPAFKAWFGDWEAATRNTSRVVDSNRKPKEQREIVVPAVVYHGTPQQKGFTWFDPEKGKRGNFFGPGFYFTSDYDVAKGYSEDYVKLDDRPERGKLKDPKKLFEIARELSGRAADALGKNKINEEEYTGLLTRIEKVLGKYKGDPAEPASFRASLNEYTLGDTDWFYLSTEEKVRDAIGLEEYLISQGREPYRGSIYTVFLKIKNPYDLDEVVGDEEINEILAMGKKIGGEYNEFYFKHLWDEITSRGRKSFTDWMLKTGRMKPEELYEDYDIKGIHFHHRATLEGKGLTDAGAVRKIWETLLKYYEGDYDYKTKKMIKAPLRHFKPGGKSGVLTRQMLFRMLSDWGNSDRGANLYTNYIKSKGYDGITHTGGWNIGTKDHKVWIAFEPEQVKSTLNEGTFNPDDPDMFKGLVRAHQRRTKGGKVARVKGYNRRGRRTAGCEKKPIKPSDKVQLFNLSDVRLDLREIKDRRFIYNPKTKEFLLGGSSVYVITSHSEEWYRSGMTGRFDDTLRGWITFNRRYNNGIIHFSQDIDEDYLRDPDNFNKAWDTIEMFKRNGFNDDVVLGGFGADREEKLRDILNSDSVKKALVSWRAHRGTQNLAS